MRRRLDLAMTLVGDPRVIFLDEPTTGLDPRSRRAMWQIVRDLVAGGVTIFLTTQYLEEADELADRIAVLDHGRLVAEGTAGRAQAPRPRRPRPPAVRRPERARGGGPRPRRRRRATTTRSPCRCPATAASGRCEALLDRLDDAAIEVDELSVHTPDLDDVFLALTGQPDNAKGATPPMSTLAYAAARLGDDAAPQPPAHAALPVADPDARRHAGRLPAAVRLRLRRHAGRRARRAVRRPRRVRQLRHARRSS